MYKLIYLFLLRFSFFALRLLSLSLLAVISDLHCTSVRNPLTAYFNNMLVWLKGKFCCVSFLLEKKLKGVTLYISILVDIKYSFEASLQLSCFHSLCRGSVDHMKCIPFRWKEMARSRNTSHTSVYVLTAIYETRPELRQNNWHIPTEVAYD